MKRLSIISAALLIPFLVASTGCHHGMFNHFGNKSPEETADKMVEHISKELKLDSKQVEKLNEMKESILKKHAENKEEIESIHNELQKEVTSDNISKEKLVSLLDKAGSTYNEIHPFIADKIIEFRSMLTPEQKELLVKKMEEFKDMQ